MIRYSGINGIILSAGLGTRLRPFTETTPKPAIPFMGVPMACFPLALFENHKINNLVINTHHLPDQVEALYRKIHWPCKNLIFSSEKKQILGSGGGIRKALPHLLGQGTFFMANADEVILPYHHFVIKEALDFHHYHKGIATIITIEHEGVGKIFGGVWVENKNSESDSGERMPEYGVRVHCFSKIPVTNFKGLHFIGIVLLHDRIKNYFFNEPEKEENILYDTITNAMKSGEEVYAYNIQAQWFETGNVQDFTESTKICRSILQKQDPPNWAQYLQQVMSLHGGLEPVIS